MMFGGSFDSAYTLMIHALPNLTMPTTNKRNAALIQKHVEESLGVKPSRGYVRFVATPEDSVAMGGRTIAAEIEDCGGNPASDEAENPSRKGSKGSRRISVKVCCLWYSLLNMVPGIEDLQHCRDLQAIFHHFHLLPRPPIRDPA